MIEFYSIFKHLLKNHAPTMNNILQLHMGSRKNKCQYVRIIKKCHIFLLHWFLSFMVPKIFAFLFINSLKSKYMYFQCIFVKHLDISKCQINLDNSFKLKIEIIVCVCKTYSQKLKSSYHSIGVKIVVLMDGSE